MLSFAFCKHWLLTQSVDSHWPSAWEQICRPKIARTAAQLFRIVCLRARCLACARVPCISSTLLPRYLQCRHFVCYSTWLSCLELLYTVCRIFAAEPDVSPTYPSEVIVPRPTPLIDLERVAPFFRDSRFPVVTWRNKENGALLFRGAAATGRRYTL